MTSIITVHKILAGTPAELLAIEGIYEATKAGHLSSFPISRDDEVIISYDGDEAVALVTFNEIEGEFWIQFGYCRPAYRRLGHYQDCIKKLRSVAKRRGYHKIHTAVHPANIAAKSSIEARGGSVQYITYVFPTDAPKKAAQPAVSVIRPNGLSHSVDA